MTYFLIFSANCQQGDQCLRYTQPTTYDDGMINELVCSEVEHEDAADKSGDVEG